MKNYILGGGITGLALGWYLKQQNIEATILEKRDRPGGWMQSTLSGGFLFEQGPRSLRPHPVTQKLVQDLDIQDEVVAIDPAAKKRYIYTKKELRQVPHAFLGMLAKGLWNDWWEKPSNQPDESVYSFFSRRFGADVAETLADAMVAGIYAGDSHQLSIKSCFPKFHDMEQEHGSLIKGFLKRKRKKGTIYSFRNGMQTLVDALARLVDIECSCEVIRVNARDDYIEIELSDGITLTADHLYLALPSSALATLFPELDSIPAVSIATVNLGYGKELLPRKGFGYLVPSKEEENILGVVFDSSAFPKQNRHTAETRLTVMLGGTRYPEVETMNSHSLETIALQAVEKHLGIEAHPDVIHVRVAQKAIPQYLVNHSERVKKIEQQLAKISNRLTLLGNHFYGVAVNECVQKAYEIASMTGGHDECYTSKLQSVSSL